MLENMVSVVNLFRKSEVGFTTLMVSSMATTKISHARKNLQFLQMVKWVGYAIGIMGK